MSLDLTYHFYVSESCVSFVVNLESVICREFSVCRVCFVFCRVVCVVVFFVLFFPCWAKYRGEFVFRVIARPVQKRLSQPKHHCISCTEENVTDCHFLSIRHERVSSLCD